ncbi:MAG TPA: O-antigen ligase family protein, partial [Gaiellaceae bacterium]|nr:O-antigen ligase family protein [Gaiellaceae bacterium]
DGSRAGAREVIGLAELAGPIACLGLAVLILGRTRRNRIAGLGYAGVGTVLLVASFSPASVPELLAAIGGAIVLAPLLAWVFRREPWLVAYGALAFIPLRVHFADHQLLVPLYAVALGAAGLLLWQLVDGDDRTRELGIASWPLALFLVWIGLSLEWSVDLHTGAIDLIAFYIPFTILALSIARLPWQLSRVRLLYGELVAMAVVFAAVGFYQYETRNIIQNLKLKTINAYAAFFRVNSVFFDPSIYGRFLVIALIPTVVLIVRGRLSGRLGIAALVFVAVAWLGLLISYSQSSFAALLVAVFLAAAVVWRWRSLLALAAAVVVIGGIVATQPKLMHALRHHTTGGLNSATHGRASLIANGIRIAKAHPALGVGLGGFEHAYSKRTHRTPRKSASHNTPVTVAAEEGGVGLLVYLWLVGALLVAAYRRIEHPVFGRLALAAGLSLVAIFVHSLAYNDFFEDPTTWGLIGLIALAAPRRVRARPPRPVEETADEPVPEMIAR